MKPKHSILFLERMKARSTNKSRTDLASAPRLFILSNLLTEDGIKYRSSNELYEADGECSPNHTWIEQALNFYANKWKAHNTGEYLRESRKCYRRMMREDDGHLDVLPF